MINQKTLDLIKHFESAHDGDLKTPGLQPKMDPIGIWTVGYGHVPLKADGTRYVGTKDKNAVYKHKYANLNFEEADKLLKEDLEKIYIPRTLKMLTRKDLTESQIGALVSFTYNCGTHYRNRQGKLIPFAIWANVNKGMTGDALFNYWASSVITAGGKVLSGLIRRRKAEAHLFLKNELKFNF